MMFEIESYIESQSVINAHIISQLRTLIMTSHPKMVETWKFKTPFYTFSGLFCYLSVEKNTGWVYVGFCDGYLMSDESGLLEGQDKQMIRKFYVKELLDTKRMEELVILLHEAIIIKETINPKFTPPNKTKRTKPF